MKSALSCIKPLGRRCRLFVTQLEDRTVPTAGYFRIVCYNVTSSDGAPNAGLDTLLQGMSDETLYGGAQQVDIVAMQEVQSQSGTSQAVVNLLNGLYGAGVYARGTLNGGSTGAGTQGIVYNTQKLQLLSEAAIGDFGGSPDPPRQPLRYKFHPIGYHAVNDFYVYNSHYKAGNTTPDLTRKLNEAMAIRSDADALGNGANIIYLGDFNTYTHLESGYQHLLSPGNGQAFDPVNAGGAWQDNPNYRVWFTQAPTDTPPSGFTGGGVDDRFDFQLNSGELTDAINLDYVSGTYHTFGHDGTIDIGGSVTDTNNKALPGVLNRTTIFNLLTTVADHLPVVADYRIITPQTISSVQINDGSPQRSMVTSLKVNFSQAPILPSNTAEAFTLTRIGGGSVTLAGSAVSGNSVTLTFTGGSVDYKSLADGRYTLTALGSKINNGNFDGNFDGAVGSSDNYVLTSTGAPPTNIFRLFGDADGDGAVSGADFNLFRLAFGGSSVIFDFEGDGAAAGSDFNQFRSRFGGSV